MKRLALLVLCLTACRPAPARSPASREGYIEVPGGRVWYRVVGGGPRTPLLVLHGGPGVPSTYLKPLAALGDERPVVFYDQLGAGKSDHPSDTTLWRMDRYLAELARVREALGLGEVHLYGHSWGGVLALDYALARPAGLRSLILGGAVVDAQRYLHDNDSLIGTLPDSVARVLRSEPPDAPTHSPAFPPAYLEYLRRFFARRQPWSPELDSAVRLMDNSSSRAMGSFMQSYDRTDRLGEVAVPTLFLVGRYDPITPEATRDYQARVAGSELVVFDSTGHLPMQDEPERYVAVLRRFLHEVEARR
ncbi:MAG TPA: proline iminopeptidase-family hydrolase [Gemmatimonadales bacterium]